MTNNMSREEIENKIAELLTAARKIQADQYKASQRRNAKRVFECERALQPLWKQIDELRAL